VSKISEDRAKKSIAISVDVDIRPVEKCQFCSFQEYTPRERIEHGSGAVSVPNLYPWEKYDWITIYPPFGEHKLLLSDLYFEDLERMVESSYDLALICARDPDVLSFMDFTNWGAFAGASQQHPHSQRKSVSCVFDPRQEQELRFCRGLLERYGRNPFDLLVEEERSLGLRVIYDNDIFIASAFAPTCADEVIVFPREQISHILQTSVHDRKRIVSPMLAIFPALFFYRGKTDLNMAVHMAPFREMEEARRYFRWHIHIFPRRSSLPIDRAGAEIGFETNVIDSLPEMTAEVLRSWFVEGPREDRVARLRDGTPNQRLVEQFHRFVADHSFADSPSERGEAWHPTGQK
jgi:galactose-1-phosphate uridylyltransferase